MYIGIYKLFYSGSILQSSPSTNYRTVICFVFGIPELELLVKTF